MRRPDAYNPQYGYQFQIFSKYKNESYEHCDYAKDMYERDYLLENYRLSYGSDFSFKVIKLPKEYWTNC